MGILVAGLAKGIPPVLRHLSCVHFGKRTTNCLRSLALANLFRAKTNVIGASIVVDVSRRDVDEACSNDITDTSLSLKGLLGRRGGFNGISFGIRLGNFGCGGQCPRSCVGKVVSSFRCDRCRCRGVVLSNMCGSKNFGKHLSVSSTGNSIRVSNGFGITGAVPSFGLGTSMGGLHPRSLRLSSGCRGTDVSLNLATSFANGSVSSVGKHVSLSDLRLGTPSRKKYFLSGLAVATKRMDNRGRLHVGSSFVATIVQNSCSCRAVPTDIMGAMRHCVPSLLAVGSGVPRPRGGFRFSVYLRGTRILSGLFRVPLRLCLPTSLGKCFGSNRRGLRMRKRFPRFECGKAHCSSNILFYRGPSSQFGYSLQNNVLVGDNTVLGFSIRTGTGGSRLRAAVG